MRVPTAAERATGIDVTGTSSGMLNISDLKANLHRHAITEELTLRGAPVSRSRNTMKAALKEHLNQERRNTLSLVQSYSKLTWSTDRGCNKR